MDYNDIRQIHEYYNNTVDNTYTLLDTMKLLRDFTNDHGGTSFVKYNEYKKSGELDKIINMYFAFGLQNATLDFLNILYNTYYDEHPYLRKVLLHESEFTNIYIQCSYPIAAYVNDASEISDDNKNNNPAELTHYQFPIYVYKLIEKFDIRYKNGDKIDYTDIYNRLYKYMDFKHIYNLKEDRDEIKPEVRFPNNVDDKYEKYKTKIDTHTLSITDPEQYPILAEQLAYEMEIDYLKQYSEYNTNELVRWISKNSGDGFGFDVLSYDPIRQREKVIEVKSSITDSYELSENEYRKALDMHNVENTDFYVYEYDFKDKSNLKLRALRYIPEEDFFIDISNYQVYTLFNYSREEDGKVKQKVAIRKLG